MQLQEAVFRCYEHRRTFERGGAISLRELSIEAGAQCKGALEMHQSVRGQLGCLSLS